MEKRNQILTAILVAQLALVLLVFWPRPAVSNAAGGPLLADFSAGNVAAITISDADGNRIELAQSGDGWILPEAGDYPADSTRIDPFLEKLGQLQANRLVTRTAGSHARLKVTSDDFERLVEVRLQDGTIHRLFIGSSAGPGATHVRLDDQPEVYLTSALTNWDAAATATTWIDPVYLSLPQEDIAGLTLQNVNGDFEFTKDDDTWTLAGLAEGETFSQPSLTTLLNYVSSMRMTRPIGTQEQDAFGMDAPHAMATVHMADGSTSTLTFGARDPADESYVVKWSESPYYVRVSGSTGDLFVDKTRDDFLEQPPEPTPALEGEEAPVLPEPTTP